MRKDISYLKNLPFVQNLTDVYIIASGASIDFLNKDFFNNKFIIGVNIVNKDFYCNLVVYKHIKDFDAINKRSNVSKMIYSEYDCGSITNAINLNNGTFFKHQQNGLDVINYPKNEDEIIVSWSTITSAMHIAAYLGVKNIILVGHDCGTINGKANYKGYYEGDDESYSDNQSYKDWLKKIEAQTIEVKQWLQKKYGCNIYSLNPFINCNMEGNIYE